MERLIIEPVLTAAAIATRVVTKAFEKTGEKIGEAVVGSVAKFISALRRKDPKTAVGAIVFWVIIDSLTIL
jgi:ABC-type proline/glycine betaine transport system substrate-binding protein